jgi:uncharacterized LabA/DUF88 family protein
MNIKKRVFVYIDGSNLYRNLKFYESAGMNFDFKGFVESFIQDYELEGIKYYIGQIRPKENDEKSQSLHKYQQVLFKKLEEAGFCIIRGRLRQIGKIFSEKGVDVRIGIDLLEGAYENKYDVALLISSDGDLAPALEMVRNKGKKVEVVGFLHKPSYALIQNSDRYHNCDAQKIKQFLPQS